MALASPGRADVAALRRSNRSKPLLLGLLCLAALAAATVSWAEQKGSGAPEDPTKVFVVSDGHSGVDHLGVLDRAGFGHPAQASLAEFEERAKKLELDGEGVEAVLALADDQGYGFVAFEHPQGLDFSGIEFQDDAPEIDDQILYAVISTGDLAFPHQLSVNPKPSEVVRMPGIELLTALYAQPRLHPERELLAHHPTVEELHVQAQIDPGLFLIKRIETLESTASNLAVDIEKIIHEGAAAPLGVPMESGGPVPLPDGGVLSVMQSVAIVSHDAFILDYELAPTLRLEYTPPNALLDGPDHRSTCTTLAGGELPVDEFPEVVAGLDGRTVLIHTASKGLEVWTWLDGAGCRFERRGVLPSPSDGERALGEPSPEGVIARVRDEGSGTTRIRLYEPTRPGEAPRLVELAALERTGLGKPVWIGARYLASGARTVAEGSVEARDAMFLFDVEQPDRVLRLDADLFGPDLRLRHMASIPGEQPALLVTTRGTPTAVYRVELGQPVHTYFDAPDPAPVVEPDALADGAPASSVRVLTLEDVRIEPLYEGGRIANPSVSPDGQWVTFARRDEDEVANRADVALLRLEPPATELVMVSEGSVEDQKPRFTADGRYVVFETRVSVNFAGHELVAPPITAVHD